jgi:hypothetical protein
MRGSWLVNKNKKEWRHYASLLFLRVLSSFFYGKSLVSAIKLMSKVNVFYGGSFAE